MDGHLPGTPYVEGIPTVDSEVKQRTSLSKLFDSQSGKEI
jgi:hypothetical protein